MPGQIELEVVTPERRLVREEVDSVELPGREGYMGILPGHAPLVGQLGTGFLAYTAGGKTRYLAVSGGFVEVLPEVVRVLADTAEKAEAIDVPRAEAALQKARADLAALPADPTEAMAAQARAEARLETAAKE
jgi:F-type H+-transporting ATPase subunit epsilon